MTVTLLLMSFGCTENKPVVLTEDSVEDGPVDLDGDGYLSDEDCDDNNSTIYPNSAELCDGIDNNCNGEVDEGVLQTYFVDSDGDGFGTPSLSSESCEQQTGTVPNDRDCDDDNPAVFPAAEEICDSIDNNCNDEIDEGVTTTQFLDADNDGFGNPMQFTEVCTIETGYVSNDSDCDDDNPVIHPNADELCDGLDNNCDDAIDDETSVDREVFYKDADNDGFGDPAEGEYFCTAPTDYVDNNADCDDIDSSVHPDALEVCDGIDNDCDQLWDELDPDIFGATLYHQDNDGDGFGDPNTPMLLCFESAGWVLNTDDCNDGDALAYTNASEVCDGVDNDCDGDIDDQDDTVDPNSQQQFFLDVDQDGFGDPNNPIVQCAQGLYSDNNLDCDDTNPTLNPTTEWFVDSDGDGFGDGNYSLQVCSHPIGYTDNNLDCDDGDSTLHPNTEWFIDNDGDGFGDHGQSIPTLTQCTPTTGLANNPLDCDDTDVLVHPNASIGCEDTDNNCDGLIDNDADGDGLSDVSCGGSDCNDTDPAIATENGSVEECSTLDCDALFQQNSTLPDGVYWIDPDGNGSFEAYCLYDPIAQVGWTLVMRAIDDNIAYNSTLWTTTSLANETDWSFTQAGHSKYESFNRVPFTEIRTASPEDFYDGFTETFAIGHASSLDLFSDTGFSRPIGSDGITYFLSLITDGFYSPWGCTQYRSYGFNQQDYLGTGFINGGSYCDWNGGARWGLRYNASHSNTGNHQGVGWGDYTTLAGYGYTFQSIRQLMWVR